MPKRIETSREMLLDDSIFALAAFKGLTPEQAQEAYKAEFADLQKKYYETQDPAEAEQIRQRMIRLERIIGTPTERRQKFEERIRQYQQEAQKAQAAGDQQSYQMYQEDIQELQNYLMGAAFTAEESAEYDRLQGIKHPAPQRQRSQPQERGIPRDPRLEPYYVRNEPAQEIEFDKEKTDSEKAINRAKGKIRKRVKDIVTALKQKGDVDREQAIQMAMSDSDILALEQLLRPSNEYLTNPNSGQGPSDFEQGYFVRDLIESQVDKLLKPEKRQPLFDDSLQKSYLQRIKVPSFLNQKEMLSEQEMFGTEDPNDEGAQLRAKQYQAYVNDTAKDDANNRALYAQFLEDFGALYRQKKQPEPSYEVWLRDIHTKSYDNWAIQNDPEYQEFLLNEFEIAERSKRAPLTDREKRILLSNVGFDEFMSYLERQDEGAEGERAPGVGLRSLQAPPADLQRVRSPESVKSEVMQMVQDEGIATTESDVERLNGLAETLWVGEIENKIADLMTYDQDVKRQLHRAAFRIRDVLNNVDRDRRPAEMSVWGFEQAMKANIKGGAGAWVERYKKRMEDIEQNPSLKDPSIRENKEAVILSELKRWIVQKVYEATSNEIKRLMRKRKRQDSLSDFMYDRETDEQIRDIKDPQDAFGTFEDEITAKDFNYDDMRKAGEYIADSKPQYRVIYDLLFNPQSDIYMGDVEPNRRQLQYAYNSVMNEDYNGQGGISVESVSNLRSRFLRDVGDYIAEMEKDEGAAERGQKLREQIGIRGPNAPAQSQPKKAPKKQQKPTRQERMKDIRNLIAER